MRDPTTKWLKTSDGGYVWEGNLAGEGIITPSGMLGMAADMPHEQIAKHVKAIGNYEGSQPGCEVYPTLDGKVDVMVLEGKASAFSTGNSALQTREGIRAGSSESQLRAAYGGKLSREENPYDGADYFYWEKPDRGIKFSVSDGVVKGITSGNKAIEYVEGCL